MKAKLAPQQKQEVQIPLWQIEPSQRPTRPLDMAVVEELAASFLSVGQQQAIKVRKLDEMRFRVIFGEHRFAAAKLLNEKSFKGWDTIRCVVEITTDLGESLLRIIENAHKNPFVDPSIEGETFTEALLDPQFDGDVTKLATYTGKSASYIKERTLIFHQLSPKLKPLVVERKLSIANAVALSKLASEQDQLKGAEQIMDVRHYLHMGGGLLNPPRKVVLEAEVHCPKCGHNFRPPNKKGTTIEV